jgi:uncharacterized protein YecE (DUF72 family)
MGLVLLGTSGYSYRDWKGVFYPEELPSEKYLAYYSSKFRLAELNFTYYKQPDSKTIEGMVGKTPGDFRFTVKAHQSMTHQITADYRDDIKRFSDGIAPLSASGKLEGVLLQFPYSFHYTRENRVYLSDICREMENQPLFLEFRGKDWQKKSVYDDMQKRKIGLVCTDLPTGEHLRNLPERSAITTAERGYIRFHGRNAENWWSGDNVSRYDYLYNGEELFEWVPDIIDMALKTVILIVTFNNHSKGKAVRNTLEIKKLLTETVSKDSRYGSIQIG